ncbi:hypothetical protein TRFO_39430 [Tritrichomonas foetus]|uniref:BEACH domain-containing protein n=1 Tax=Tritrichomonas foetus TaxID=1144522 RepID=A0A1J4J6V8_9EUKA|nr:hypothetical protein TRFO_39430 [Tritrichomonas foetus]|eukprot:OHS94385.1 hypothetical protein TRFO_39430 [Tritrichomonas foetus]
MFIFQILLVIGHISYQFNAIIEFSIEYVQIFMGRRTSIWRASTLKFLFDIEKFRALTTHHEKITNITTTLQNFSRNNPNLAKIHISQQVQNTMEQFASVISEYIDVIVTKVYLEVAQFLSVYATLKKELPNSEKYRNFTDLICHYCFSDKKNQNFYIDTFHFLFSQQKLCDSLVQNSQMHTLIHSFSKGTVTDNLIVYCDAIYTPQLVKSFKSINSSELIPQLFQFTIAQRAPMLSIYAILLFLTKITYKVQKNDPNLMEALIQTDFFNFLNMYLKTIERPAIVTNFYSLFIKCVSHHSLVPYNSKVLEKFINLFKEVKVQTQVAIFHFLYTFDDLFKETLLNSEYCFPIQNFILKSVICDSDCFEALASILEKFIKNFPPAAEKAIVKILKFLKPPLNKAYQYDLIFDWFTTILHKGVTPEIFHDKDFLDAYVIKPPNEIVYSYLKFPTFLSIISILIDQQRTRLRKDQLIDKMTKLAVAKPDVQNNLLSLISDNFGSDILRFYLKNMEKPEIRDTFVTYLPFNSYDFRNLFISGNCFKIVLTKMSSEAFLYDFLKFIHLIVYQTNDHFFDEWVIQQPKESPLFKLDKTHIQDYIISPHHNAAIYIPSLLPLIDIPFKTESPFNMYLISRFSKPVYEKLGIENPYYSELYAYYITDTSEIKVGDLPAKCDEFPCYEFFPKSPAGYLKVTVPVTSISFNIRFNRNSPEPICFLRFSDTSMIFQDNKIMIGTEFSVDVSANEWIKISLRPKMFSRTEVTVNNVLSTIGRAFQFECLGDNNGLTFISYQIDNNIIINDNEHANALIKICGSAVFTPIHTISHLLEVYHHFLSLVKRFVENDETRNIPFLLQFSKFIQKENIISFFVDIFTVILKVSDRCDKEWIPVFIDSLLTVQDIQQRTSILNSLLFDIDTMTNLSMDNLLYLLETIMSKIDVNTFDNDLIFSSYNFIFSILVLNHFSHDQFRILFLSFWKMISKSLRDTKLVFEIVQFCFTYKFNCFNFSENINKFDIAELLKDYSAISEYRTILINFIFDLENCYQTNFFNIEQLLELAISQDENTSKKALQKIICRNIEKTTILNNMPIFTIIFQRFSTQEFAWSFLLDRMVKQNSFMNINYDKISNNVENQELIALMFSMIKVLGKTDLELKLKAYEFICFILPKIDNGAIFDERCFSNFYDLITGGRSFNNNVLSEGITLQNISTFISDSSDVLASKIYQSIPLFSENFVHIYDQFIVRELSDSFCEFNLLLFLKLVDNTLKYPKYLSDLLNILLKVNNEIFIQNTILHILKQVPISDVHDNSILLLKKFFVILADNKPTIFSDIFIKKLIANCVEFAQFAVLTSFFVFKYDFKDISTFLSLLGMFSQKLVTTNGRDAAFLAVRLVRIVVNEEQEENALNSFLEMFIDNEDIVTKFIGPLFAHLICSLHNASSILFDPSLETAITEFSQYYSVAFDEILTRSSYPTVMSNNDMIQYARFMVSKVSRSVMFCYKENKTFFSMFNSELRRKEYYASRDIYKQAIKGFQDHHIVDQNSEKRYISHHISFQISPYSSPYSHHSVISPSCFTLRTPNNCIQMEKIDLTLLSFKPKKDYSIPISNQYPSDLFRHSGIYHCSGTRILTHFQNIYGPIENTINCTLIRVDLRIPSVMMKINNGLYLVMTDTTMKEKKLKFLELHRDLCEDFINGNYGKYTMFCGHFVLIILPEDILYSSPYISLTNPNSVSVISATVGSFILDFEGQYDFPLISSHRKYTNTLNDIKNDWLDSRLSNFDYLMYINTFAYRSWCDLSSYPIFPRIIKEFNQNLLISSASVSTKEITKEFTKEIAKEPTNDFTINQTPNDIPDSNKVSTLESNLELAKDDNQNDNQESNHDKFAKDLTQGSNKELTKHEYSEDATEKSTKVVFEVRDLSLPVQISSDECDTSTFRKRYESEKYFYSENLSNPMFVAGISLRLSPFCREIWYLNDGWDHGSRNFISIPSFFSTKKTNYEFPPDAFIDNTFVNWNNFKLPNGEKLEITFPEWANNNPYKFAELHRYALEMLETRTKLNKWIDLVFGHKQQSIEDMNIFSPLSYMNDKSNDKNNEISGEQQKGWMLQCGRVPKKVFENGHEQFIQKASEFHPNEIKMIFYDKIPNHYQLFGKYTMIFNKGITVMNADKITKVNNSFVQSLWNRSFHITRDLQYIALTNFNDSVVIYRIIYDNDTPLVFRPLSRINILTPLLSRINTKHLICATSCTNELVIWLISTGVILNRIQFNNIKVIEFDEVTDSLFVGAGKTLHQLNLNGFVVRQIELPYEISALACFGFGFSFVDRIIVVGHEDGSVRVCKICFETGEFEVVKEGKVSHLPISAFDVFDWNHTINVFDLESKFPVIDQ